MKTIAMLFNKSTTLYITIAALCTSIVNTGCNENKAAAAPAQQNNIDTAFDKKDYAAAYKNIAGAKLLLQDGDLVTRSDNDFESATLQNFSNTDRSFSHSGIAFKEDGVFYIYHSMTGAENPSGKCRRDPFDTFVSPVKKTGLGIFRYNINDKEKEAFHSIVKQNVVDSIPFDLTFNINSNDSLYCSEMIYKALKKCTHNRVVLPTSKLYNFRPKIFGYKYKQVLLKNFEYISIDNLYLNSFCKEIKRVLY